MAFKKFDKGSSEFSLFADFWSFCQKYWIVEGENEDYWESMTNDGNALIKKYEGIPFARYLVNAFVSYADSVAKTQREKTAKGDGE